MNLDKQKKINLDFIDQDKDLNVKGLYINTHQEASDAGSKNDSKRNLKPVMTRSSFNVQNRKFSTGAALYCAGHENM